MTERMARKGLSVRLVSQCIAVRAKIDGEVPVLAFLNSHVRLELYIR